MAAQQHSSTAAQQNDSYKNKLIYGDCLDVLKKLKSNSSEGFIDLIYIDPPFNSKRDYNILFENADLRDAKSQKEAFADTWSNVSYKDTLQEIKVIDLGLYTFLNSLDSIDAIQKSAVAYLTTMALRIWYIHKVLKKTGSFYLHCDPTMSHYLKLLCDLIFGERNFRNDIIWHYYRWANVQNQLQSQHDNIFLYSKSKDTTFHEIRLKNDVTRKRNLVELVDGKKVSKRDEKGEIIYIEQTDRPLSDVWILNRLGNTSHERLGYPTQKTVELLERVIEISSNEGDLVADFFCGCGTTISAAQHLNRHWLGVDISHLAIGLIERRLVAEYGKDIKKTFEVDGFPKDLGSAKQLALEPEGGRFKFQDWIIEAMLGGIHNPKKTADGGWDGHMTFDTGNKKEIVLIEVKSGNVNVKNLREFIHVVDKQKAGIGLFVCFDEQVTKPMLLEAKDAGYYYYSDSNRTGFDKIQIVTIEGLLQGDYPKIPNSMFQTFKTARKREKESDQPKLEL